MLLIQCRIGLRVDFVYGGIWLFGACYTLGYVCRLEVSKFIAQTVFPVWSVVRC